MRHSNILGGVIAMFKDRFLVSALICVLLVGCSSSVRQEYLVAAEDGAHKNYFRVTIQAEAYFTTSEFQIGNVDPVVVDRLLGEGQRVILDVPQEEIDKSEKLKRLATDNQIMNSPNNRDFITMFTFSLGNWTAHLSFKIYCVE